MARGTSIRISAINVKGQDGIVAAEVLRPRRTLFLAT
jgi:hypothetical protein